MKLFRILRLFLATLLLMTGAPSAMAQNPAEIMEQAITQITEQIAQLEARIATARAEDPESVPGLEQQRDMLKEQLEMLEGMSSGDMPEMDGDDVGIDFSGLGFDGDTKFPALQVERLAALPKDNINKDELRVFLNETYNDLKEQLPAEKTKEALTIIGKCTEPEECALLGVLAYYEGAPSAAVLLLTYAASQSPTDIILNNCGAILNQCGLEDRAIPCLNYVLTHEPGNSTVLNNLGQAYAGLGDRNEAMRYLGAAMRASPNHPEACATAAYIEAERGNTQQALEYMEQAMQDGHTERRVRFLEDNNGGQMPRWTMGGIDLTNPYIMRNDIIWPPQTRQWASCASDHELQEAFANTMNGAIAKCMATISSGSGMTLTGPTSWLSNAVTFKMHVIGEDWGYQRTQDFEDLMKKIQDLTERAQQTRLATDASFEPKYKACRGDACEQVAYDHCKQRVADEDRTSSELADAAEHYRLTNFPKDLDYINKIIWLMALRSTDARFLKVEQATQTMWLLQNFLSMIMSQCDPVGAPNCETLNPANPANQAALNIKDAACPINAVIPIYVGPVNVVKMTLNCKVFKIEGGAGVKFTYERDFVKRETTVAVGPGVEIGNPWIAEAGVKGQLFVKFDNNNEPSDFGVSAEAEVELTGVQGPDIPAIKTGMTIGVNSGFQGNAGTLQPLVELLPYAWN